MGGWCWRRLADTLRSRGARCYTPTLTGVGERQHLLRPDIGVDLHVEDVLNVCRFENISQPLLVGHSYGALVATAVADRMHGHIRGLVNIDGYLVEPGQSAFDAYPEVQELLKPCVSPTRASAITPLSAAHLGVEDTEIAAELARNLRPMPLATHTTPLHFSPARQRELPRTYIRCTGFPVFETTARRAAEQGWRVLEISTGHMGIMTDPELVAEAVLTAVAG